MRAWTTFSGIAFSRYGDHLTAALPEKLWASNHAELLSPVREAIDDGVRRVTLDLANTQYVDGAAAAPCHASTACCARRAARGWCSATATLT